MRLHGYDLAMYDDPFDVSAEPNFETDNFFNSPNIINCIGQVGTNDCIEDVSSLEEEDNTIKITVYNNGSYYPTSGSVVETYWTIASTGEMWPNHWVDQDLTDDCVRGNFIDEVPIPWDLLSEATLDYLRITLDSTRLCRYTTLFRRPQ